MTHASAIAERYPWVTAPLVVCASMTSIAGPELAVAVSRAGGLGFIGPSTTEADTVANLEKATSLVQELRASSAAFNEKPAPNGQLPVGVGFLLWKDDAAAAAAAIQRFKPCAAWLYAPKQAGQLEEWSRKIRAAAPATQIWIQIGTAHEATALLQSSERPDVVVVQGAESGGHGRKRDGMGLTALLPEVADVMAASGIPLVAAGGIADGRGVAAAMCLGASGAVMGTRFIATPEARIPRGYQDTILRTSDPGASTTRTLLYNHLGGQYGWPDAYEPRVIINKSFTEYQDGKPFDELKRLFDESTKLGDQAWGPDGRRTAYAGASVGLIHDVKDAMEVVLDVRQGALERIRSLL